MAEQRTIADLNLFEDSMKEFEAAQGELDVKLNSAVAELDASFARLDSTVKAHKSQWGEYAALKKMLVDLTKENSNLAARDPKLSERLNDYSERLEELAHSLERMRALKPRTGSVLLKLFLGRVNAKVWKKSELLNLKMEYNRFRDNATILFLFHPIVFLLIKGNLRYAVMTAHQIFLLYFYLSLSLRENVLLVNGSDIRSWWIYHHYASSIISLTVLVWPHGECREWFSTRFAWFLVWQGVIMLVQSWYQRARFYVRMSLGKANSIDPAASETLVEKPTNLKILIPLLYLTYMLQLALGVSVLASCGVCEAPIHMLIMGTLLVTLATGNAFTTGKVMVGKTRVRARRNHALQASGSSTDIKRE